PSKKPGFTRKIYFYGVGSKPGRELILSDRPGYGYGSTTEQGDVILEYLRTAANLKMVYILMDSRVLEMPRQASRKGVMGASEQYYKDEIIVTSDKTMIGVNELKWSIMRHCGLVSE
ncbi:hypothetical protein V1524DRAFT_412102, partial [Lipomyces starkeyi]